MHKLGLALSGGGVKGAAHVGVMKAMEEHGLEAGCISGASAGALVGAFYAQGYQSEEILRLFGKSALFELGNFSLTKPGLLDPEKFISFFEKYLSARTFEDLEKELHVATTDLITAKSVIHNSGPLIPAVIASCAFPMVFAPMHIGDSLHADGGIINNFPVEAVRDQSEKVLGVYVSPLKKIAVEDLDSVFEVMDRVYRISNRYSSLEKIEDCDWVVDAPELQNYGTFAMSKIEEVTELGYHHAREIMPELEKALS